MPAPRQEDRHDGVDCECCHRVAAGIAGPFGAATEAHPSVRHPSFSLQGSISLCESCHDTTIGPVRALAREFRASGLAERGRSCVGCHMERTLRPIAQDPRTGRPDGPERDGRSHAIRGPGDPEFCASAFKIAVVRIGDELELSIGNRAGHRVPGLTLRRFPLQLVQLGANGDPLSMHQVTIAADNPLFVRETRRFRFPLARRAVRAETVMIHELSGTEIAELSREVHSW
jgi:hypothetical protein